MEEKSGWEYIINFVSERGEGAGKCLLVSNSIHGEGMESRLVRLRTARIHIISLGNRSVLFDFYFILFVFFILVGQLGNDSRHMMREGKQRECFSRQPVGWGRGKRRRKVIDRWRPVAHRAAVRVVGVKTRTKFDILWLHSRRLRLNLSKFLSDF